MKADLRIYGFLGCCLLLAGLVAWKDDTPDPQTPAALGALLFNDPILSLDSSVSCASCHIPRFAFADTVALSVGIDGRLTTRNTPSAMNTLSRVALMWDGRAATLEDQALLPLEHPEEMSLHRDSAVARLLRHPSYAPWFRRIYSREADLPALLHALASFERTLETSDTPNDRWIADVEPGMTGQQLRGRELFFGKANCIECHFTPDFTGDEFRNIGLYTGAAGDDAGRFEITKDSSDLGRFKVPGLRNVAVTAPYMHDGRFRTLREVLDFYNDPSKELKTAVNADTLIRPLGLNGQELEDLEAFLHALTDDRFVPLSGQRNAAQKR